MTRRLHQQQTLLRLLIQLRAGVSVVREHELQIEWTSEAREHARDEVARLRRQLYEQVVEGPMTAIEAHEFLSPHLDGAPLDLLLAVVATLDQARRDGQKTS